MKYESQWEVGKSEVTLWHRWAAQLFLALKENGPALPPIRLALAIPQSGCCFSFGTAKLPLPAGAALLLWERDPHATGTCPDCGGDVVATAFGGLLSIGGYQGICLACARPMFRWIGGLAAVSDHVRPLLNGTPWHLAGARFGGAIVGDGLALARALGQGEPPQRKGSDAPVVKVGEHRLVFENVEIENGGMKRANQ